MNILLFGSGGREHALAWASRQAPLCDQLFCAPGNPGIAADAALTWRSTSTDHPAVIAFLPATTHRPRRGRARRRRWSPGSSTISRRPGSRRSARRRAAAQLEGSKGFTKDLCAEFGIPTAAYRRFTDADAAKAYLRERGAPIVVKADGLAAGKGVVDRRDGRGGRGGDRRRCSAAASASAGAEVVIEEFLDGEEASFFALCDGETRIPLGSAQDHKRVGDGDTGPEHRRHGRLFAGAGSDARACRPRVMHEIVAPTLAGMAARGTPFRACSSPG